MIGTICFADDWRLATDDWIYNASMLGPLIGAGAMVAAGAAAYHSMAPWAQGFGASFVGGNPALKQIALTYDDGPNDPHTLQLMDVLEKDGVRATFFSLGVMWIAGPT